MPQSALGKWDRRFLELAEHIARWSKDPSTRVGAVVADSDNRLVSVGYNGFARGVEDTLERLNDRDKKYPLTLHGELNAVLFGGRAVRGCRLYTWPMQPCAPCASVIIQVGIIEVVCPSFCPERWATSFALARELFSEAGISLRLFDLDIDPQRWSL